MTDERRVRADAFLATGADYHRVRPGYPDDAVDWMLPDGARTVLDLGAGSGRLTDALVARGLDVVGVDPSASMLAVLAERHPGVRCVVGTGEATGLPDAACDAIVVGQAWHWFDPDAARAECARILRPGGTLAIVWNQRRPQPGWQEEFDAIQASPRGRALAEYAEPRPPFGPTQVFTTTWSREVARDDFVALYTTHSPFLVSDAAEQARRLAAWQALLDAHAGAKVTEEYVTEVWRARLP